MLSTVLEIARGLAAAWVFLYHIRAGLTPGFVRDLAEAGFLGVPAFFVISGYCMMASSRATVARGQTAANFLARRLRRIYPPLWFSVAVAIVMPFVTAGALAWRTGAMKWPVTRWLEYTPVDWLALLTLTKGLFTTGAAHKPWSAVNSVYWSLAIEVQFYLVMAVAVACGRRLMAVLLGASAVSIAWYFGGLVAPGLFVLYWPMFGLGLALHFVLDKGVRPRRLFGSRTLPASVAILGALAGTALALTLWLPSVTLERQTLFALMCGLMLWTASGIEPAIPKEAYATRAFTELGKMSYSLYLLHVPLVPLATGLLRPFLWRHSIVAHFSYITATLPLVYLFYRYCEKPFAGGGGRKQPVKERANVLSFETTVSLRQPAGN